MSDKPMEMSRFHSWELERFEYLKKVQASEAPKIRSDRKLDGGDRVKFSEIQHFIRLARDTPELWEGFAKSGRLLTTDPQVIENHQNGYDPEVYTVSARLLGDFDDILRIRSGDATLPKRSIGGVPQFMLKVAMGECALDDTEALRRMIEWSSDHIDFDN